MLILNVNKLKQQSKAYHLRVHLVAVLYHIYFQQTNTEIFDVQIYICMLVRIIWLQYN